MSRILLASELGANLGHVGQLLPLAIELQARGHEIVFALRDVSAADALLRARGFRCMQAPIWQRRAAGPAAPPCSYSEILLRYGYADSAGLLGLVSAWRELYRHVAPQIVIAEYAPTALLAARGLPIARIQYGVGFSIPPRVSPFPSFRTWESVPRERLETSDATVLANINRALEQSTLPPLSALTGMLDAERELLCTFRELDHYPQRQGADYHGPVYMDVSGAVPTWPDAGTSRVFVYLRPGRDNMQRVARALADTAASVLWIAPGLSPTAARRLESSTLRIATCAVRIADAAAAADVAVLHGGHGTVAAMLLAGVPLVLYPTHVEQAIVAGNITRLGAGVASPADAGYSHIGSVVTKVLGTLNFKNAAEGVAVLYRDYDARESARRMADEIELEMA
ncbi:MAG TPA: nucleotide disphospho-sugar-binding domain-containing protein [Burkholderiales bacterium]|nr:nucleotide disphospho-sugar-binding domain-containing protein [Burkholderiales bacterium]